MPALVVVPESTPVTLPAPIASIVSVGGAAADRDHALPAPTTSTSATASQRATIPLKTRGV